MFQLMKEMTRQDTGSLGTGHQDRIGRWFSNLEPWGLRAQRYSWGTAVEPVKLQGTLKALIMENNFTMR